MFQEVQLHAIVQWHVDMKDIVELLHAEIELVLGNTRTYGNDINANWYHWTATSTAILFFHISLTSSFVWYPPGVIIRKYQVNNFFSLNTSLEGHTQITDVNS